MDLSTITAVLLKGNPTPFVVKTGSVATGEVTVGHTTIPVLTATLRFTGERVVYAVKAIAGVSLGTEG